MRRITIKEAKEGISIVAYLAEHGYYPMGMSGKRHRFCSVFRKEKEPSLFVENTIGLWNDFGYGGGSIIDLAMGLHNFTSIPEVLDHLTPYFQNISFKPLNNIANQNSIFYNVESKSIKNVKVQSLNHWVLLKYLREERGISESLAKHYLRLVWYTNKNKDRFAIGWENNKGAFELRGAGKNGFKAITGKKAISTIVGNPKIKTAFIFESMLDFLSALMMKNQTKLDGTTYILNSTSLVKRVIPLLEDKEWDDIHLFFDNDRAGEEAKDKLISGYSNSSKIRIQTFYKDFNDVNEYWVTQ